MGPITKKDTPEQRKYKQSLHQREKDLAKHMRIAAATTGHEQEVHLAKAKEIKAGISSLNSFFAGAQRMVKDLITK